MRNLECIWPHQAQLGEGARYDPREHAVWWVDILGQRIFRLGLSNGDRLEIATPTTVGAVFPTDTGGVLALLRRSLASVDRATKSVTDVLTLAGEPAHNRFNDGVIGQDGSLWVASMDYDCERPSGALYAIGSAGAVTLKDRGYVVANGPAISADGRLLFVNDTMSGHIFCFDLEFATNALRNKRVFAEVPRAEGMPDGLCVDSEGGVWVALVTGGKVRRYRPDGAVDVDIPLPTPIVTSVSLGGADKRTLFVTTGRILLSDAELAEHPASGGLFQVTVDYEAVPAPVCTLRLPVSNVADL